jgi:hypothetical protein
MLRARRTAKSQGDARAPEAFNRRFRKHYYCIKLTGYQIRGFELLGCSTSFPDLSERIKTEPTGTSVRITRSNPSTRRKVYPKDDCDAGLARLTLDLGEIVAARDSRTRIE